MEWMIAVLAFVGCLLLGAGLHSAWLESANKPPKNGSREPIYIMQGQGEAAVAIYADMRYHVDTRTGRTFENVQIAVPLGKDGQPDAGKGYFILRLPDGKTAYLHQKYIVCIIEAEKVAEAKK